MSAATATILTGVAVAATAGTALYAAHEQSSAAKEAAATQKSFSDEALAYEKERDAYNRRIADQQRQTEANRYGAMTSASAPYRATGTAANAAMARFLGLPAPPAGAPSAPSSAPGPTEPSARGMMPPPEAGGGSSAPGMPSSGRMVLMQAPDGTTKQVPADQEPHWVSRGARRIDQGQGING